MMKPRRGRGLVTLSLKQRVLDEELIPIAFLYPFCPLFGTHRN